MNILERQRRASFLKGLWVPFMVLAFVCTLLADTNALRADAQPSVLYDSGCAIADMQKQSPVFVESSTKIQEAEFSRFPIKFFSLLLFLLHALFALPTALLLPVRHYWPTLRKTDTWGLIPFSLAPPLA